MSDTDSTQSINQKQKHLAKADINFIVFAVLAIFSSAFLLSGEFTAIFKDLPQ